MFRNVASWVMLALFPLSLMASDNGAAMMYVKGTAWVNGSGVIQSSAVFPGDLVQTKPSSVAKINASGSSVSVLSDSAVKFESNAVSLDHGSVAVATSKGLSTHAGQVTVAPAGKDLTQFEVHNNTDGTVQIMAHKGDLSVSDSTGTVTLAEGQQTTRYASADRKGGAAPAAGGGVLDSPIVIGIGIAAIAGLITWVLLQGSHPASPVKP